MRGQSVNGVELFDLLSSCLHGSDEERVEIAQGLPAVWDTLFELDRCGGIPNID